MQTEAGEYGYHATCVKSERRRPVAEFVRFHRLSVAEFVRIPSIVDPVRKSRDFRYFVDPVRKSHDFRYFADPLRKSHDFRYGEIAAFPDSPASPGFRILTLLKNGTVGTDNEHTA